MLKKWRFFAYFHYSNLGIWNNRGFCHDLWATILLIYAIRLHAKIVLISPLLENKETDFFSILIHNDNHAQYNANIFRLEWQLHLVDRMYCSSTSNKIQFFPMLWNHTQSYFAFYFGFDSNDPNSFFSCHDHASCITSTSFQFWNSRLIQSSNPMRSHYLTIIFFWVPLQFILWNRWY